MVKLDDIVDQLSKLSVLDAAELAKKLEDKWGVTASAVAAAPAAANSNAGGEDAAKEKSEFNVTLKAVGDKKINVIKAVREITQLGLKEAKEKVDSAPFVLVENAPQDEAKKYKEQLEAAGATVELK